MAGADSGDSPSLHSSPTLAALSRALEGCPCRPANGLLDEVIDWHSPSDYRDQLAQLKASLDTLNASAFNEPGWSTFYAEVNSFYEQHKDVGWTDLPGEELWRSIQDRKRRVAEWAEQLRATGKPVYEPAHEEMERTPLLGGLSNFATPLAVIVAGFVLYKAVK